MAEFNGFALGEYGLPGPLRDELVAAILAGAKTATSSLYAAYGDEPLPRVGEGFTDVAAWRAAHADFWGEHPLSDASLVVA